MLTEEQKQFLLSLLNAIEFRFTLNSNSLVGYIFVQGTIDELTQFLNELRKINDQLVSELSLKVIKEGLWENEQMDPVSDQTTGANP